MDQNAPRPQSHSLGFLATPAVVGLILLASIVFGFASDAVLSSDAAVSVALVVAAALILVPPVTYAIAPDEYIQYHRHLKRAIAELQAPLSPDTGQSPTPDSKQVSGWVP